MSEKDLYSKLCVAECINSVVSEANKFIEAKKIDKLSCNLATILARDREVVAIELYLRNISKDASVKLEPAVLHNDIMTYCSVKFESRLKRLKNDIISDKRKDYIKRFMDFALINVNNQFLRHLQKVGSYAESIIDIIECARNIKYKPLFSNIELHLMKPIIITDQPIFSWENVIKKFIDNEEYERFTNKCLEESFIMEKIRKIYTDKTTQQLKLDTVSKRFCYLCELYIDFARKQGYNIILSGTHKKIYHGWKLPHVADSSFKIKSLEYLLENLDRIIENKITSLEYSDSDYEEISDSGYKEIMKILRSIEV
ncbi:4932_t:CDS:2 [Diversispora eburnea]|uniref:4932_t:CDS:1 n=1 Tax=Diversispora eburnea TaxID=1213867 RepID=A0A9N8VD23_9GLOM|nr:4932_t:CDS:2 [Diversispora eburnea]